jgi:hypothetical protein
VLKAGDNQVESETTGFGSQAEKELNTDAQIADARPGTITSSGITAPIANVPRNLLGTPTPWT